MFANKQFVFSLTAALLLVVGMLTACQLDEGNREPKQAEIIAELCENPYHPGLILLVTTVNEIPYGASLPMVMVVTTSAYDQTHQFTSSQRYDFAIYNEDGEKVWHWAEDEPFLPVVGTETYTTDCVFVCERMNTGELPAETATYTLIGTLVTEGTDEEKKGPAHVCTTFKVVKG